MEQCQVCECYQAVSEEACVCTLLGQDRPYLWVPGTAPLSPQQEAQEVAAAWRRDKKALGRPYYVVASEWFALWASYSGYDTTAMDVQPAPAAGQRPGPIDSAALLADWDEELRSPTIPSPLRRDLQQHEYVVLPPLVWLRLWAWYGGGPCIKRCAVPLGLVRQIVDLWPVHVAFKRALQPHQLISQDLSQISVMQFSSECTFQHVRHWICTFFNHAPHLCSILMYERRWNGVQQQQQQDHDVPETTPLRNCQFRVSCDGQ